jgi:nitrate reductase alpha subunit
MSWIKDIYSPKQRSWEEFYRNRWSFDKYVRTTHGVNCTGSCSWNVFVKEGIITWELQATDYPETTSCMPPHEPRGCQRGISASWYVYSPIRVKYPYIRGELLDLWKQAKEEHGDLLKAWEAIVNDDEKRKKYQKARGMGGFRRVSWEEALEIATISCVHTTKKYGPDRVVGFSPIPAMSMLSYAAGSRFLQLLGGINLSFYDWYCDLPPASPEIWGEQTDVQVSADWYNGKYIVSMGSNLNMTRTPDVHFVAEARHAGAKFVVLSPDFSQVSKYSDWWIPINAGQDGAFWMAVSHVILKEFYNDREDKPFEKYLKQYSDCPHLVVIEKNKNGNEPGRYLHASALKEYEKEENNEWKFLFFDKKTNSCKIPMGSVGHRWGKEEGKWNLELKDSVLKEEIDPVLSFINDCDKKLEIYLHDFSSNKIIKRGVPVKNIKTKDGEVCVTTVFDLIMAQYGIDRGLSGEYPKSYDDQDQTYTPAWQEKFTGINRQTVIKFAREFATNAEMTGGKNTVIIGAGINHWLHNNLIYRSVIVSLMLTGSIGKNGGGLAHYVGQEKLAPMGAWSSIALAKDWILASRLQNAPSWHYIHSDQFRYDKHQNIYNRVPKENPLSNKHTADMQVLATNLGWLPFYPQFKENSIELAKEAKKAGAKTDEEIVNYVLGKLKNGSLKFAVEDPDQKENWPRIWFIWRGNALSSSAKGHEFFLKHYLGTDSTQIKEEDAKNNVKEIKWHEKAPTGKMDLVIDLNFRMDTSALYSDIILPAAMWYEKNDMNSTDMHSFIHPLQEVVPPCWESKSDWDIFKELSKKFSEIAPKYIGDTVDDIVVSPLAHDTPAEISQLKILDWRKGECEPIPGKTMPNITPVLRDYKNLYNRYISYGPNVLEKGIGAHGANWKIDKEYNELLDKKNVKWENKSYPSLEDAKDAANTILHLSPETNGEVAYRAFEIHEKKVGLPLLDLAIKTKNIKMDFSQLAVQPRRLLNSPSWSGIVDNDKTYSPFTMNVEKLVPWRTLTGRQHFYLDHEGYLDFGEHLPTYKPKPDFIQYGDFKNYKSDSNSVLLNYLTPHGKWHIHSTYGDTHRMHTLSRGIEPFWMSEEDAQKIGIKDNDWVEVTNENGVVVTRCVISARIPKGIAIFYHAPERTITTPKSPSRGNRRAGVHNSLTRTRLKPILMMGGYGQFSYHFNYWGPTGINRDTFVSVKKLDKLEI